MRLKTTLFIAAIACSTSASAIIRCEFNGKPVNQNNGAETAGLTGLLRCRNEDTGQLQREQELKNGKYLGIERFFDREGRLMRERSVNERGNSQGRVAEFWPNGQLKREETADNGRTQGAVRRFSEQGKLERMGFYADGREQFVLEFNAAGQPMQLQCPATSLWAEDRKPCGFAGSTQDTDLYSHKGVRFAQVRYEQGRMLTSTEWDANGGMTAQRQRVNGHRVHRSYSTEGGKPVLREERIFEMDERPLNERYGLLTSLKRWGASGQITEQRLFTGDRETAVERWYLNGAQRERSLVRGEGDQTRITRELFSDDGQLTERLLLTANERPTGTQQHFHPNGRMGQEDIYSAPDANGRTRLQSRKTWDESGQLTADDTILEDGSRQRRMKGTSS